nr:ferredoxin [Streptomyces sp. SID4919]
MVTGREWDTRVDPRLCLASGMCAGIAPEVFTLDGEHARVREDRIEPDDRVLAAAEVCPARAITVLDRNTVIGPSRD